MHRCNLSLVQLQARFISEILLDFPLLGMCLFCPLFSHLLLEDLRLNGLFGVTLVHLLA